MYYVLLGAMAAKLNYELQRYSFHAKSKVTLFLMPSVFLDL